IGASARRQGVNGLHVHVGVASPDACFHALEGILPWLPLVLALSVNSPYLAGAETGLLSNRAVALAELPRSGAPPAFRSYVDWEAWVERLVRIGVTADYTRFWWDVRPPPRFGQLELLAPAVQELGVAELLELGDPEALRQLEIGRSRGLEALCADLVERTVSSA